MDISSHLDVYFFLKIHKLSDFGDELTLSCIFLQTLLKQLIWEKGWRNKWANRAVFPYCYNIFGCKKHYLKAATVLLCV